MKKGINLIPSEMSVPSKIVNLGNLFNRLSIVSVVLLVLILIGFVAGIFYYNNEYKKSASNIVTLTSQIENLQRNEQRLILAKDKLGKISYVLGIDSIDDEISYFSNFRQVLPTVEEAVFNEITLAVDRADTTLVFTSLPSLNQVLSTLKNFSDYSRIILTTFGYNSSSGYLLGLNFEE